MRWPWSLASQAAEEFVNTPIHEPSAGEWRRNKLAELSVVIVTAALIAAVVSAAFSWPAIDSSPWTVKATFYAALILSLVAVSVGSQQSIALSRLGTVTRSQLYIWQLPVMITNISILLFLIGMLIIIWSKATQYAVWDDELKIAFVASRAGIYGLANYLFAIICLY